MILNGGNIRGGKFIMGNPVLSASYTLLFDGSTNYLTRSDTGIVSNTEIFQLAMWININTLVSDGVQVLFNWSNRFVAPDNFIYLGILRSGGQFYLAGQMYANYEYDAGFNSSTPIAALSTGRMFLVYEYNGTDTHDVRMKFWINNSYYTDEVVISGTIPIRITTRTDCLLRMGNFIYVDGNLFFYKGYMDSVAMKVGSLWTEEELLSFYAGGSGDYNNYTNYDYLWKMNEGIGNDINDSGVNANHLINNGATWIER